MAVKSVRNRYRLYNEEEQWPSWVDGLDLSPRTGRNQLGRFFRSVNLRSSSMSEIVHGIINICFAICDLSLSHDFGGVMSCVKIPGTLQMLNRPSRLVNRCVYPVDMVCFAPATLDHGANQPEVSSSGNVASRPQFQRQNAVIEDVSQMTLPCQIDDFSDIPVANCCAPDLERLSRFEELDGPTLR